MKGLGQKPGRNGVPAAQGKEIHGKQMLQTLIKGEKCFGILNWELLAMFQWPGDHGSPGKFEEQVKSLWAEEMGGGEVEACVDFSFGNSTMETQWVTRAELGGTFWNGFVFSFSPKKV